jgi:DNA-binding MarR family transcriptional regulator
MSQDIHQTAYLVGNFFVSDIYAYYQDTYKGVLGKVQVEALDYIHRSEKASIKELATVLNISKQHASKIAGKLEELGYARKEKDPNDGRGILYTLTDAGSRFINEHINMSNRHFSEVLASFSEADREQLLSGLRILEEVLAKRIVT